MDAGQFGEHAQRAARAYGAAADHYDRAPLGFWDKFGAATVSRLGLKAGDRVLDLCCGAGASALPAARAVGGGGRVTGVDVAEPLLALARTRAAAEGLANVEFRCADAGRTGLPAAGFDAVVCVFGVFFAPDMAAFTTEMWRLVRPGGVLALTVWGPGLFEPANTVFWESVRDVEPALFKAFNPWDEITTPEALTALFARAGVAATAATAATGAAGAAAEPEAGEQRLREPGDFWDVVLGSGYRATVDALSADKRASLRDRVLSELRARKVTAIRTDVIYGTARRPVALQ
jgi:ubiquinone/menaquinone biosynthesis C-methylase UbiE